MASLADTAPPRVLCIVENNNFEPLNSELQSIMSYSVQLFQEPDLTTEQVHSMIDLLWLVWPNERQTAAEAATQFIEQQKTSAPHLRKLIYLIFDENEQVIAHAEGDLRIMFTPDGVQEVMALGGVCTHPEKRGLGLGAAVVRAAFSRVDDGTFAVSVFQTPVADFYARLGSAICKNNTWVDRTNKESPEAHPWEPGEILMYYPASYDWPTGEIDINGEQY